MDDLRRRIAALSPQKRAFLEQRLREQGRPVHPHAIPPRKGDGPVVLSSAQQRLWFIDQLEAGLPLYNIANGLRLRGSLDVQALRSAFDALIERHEILRTTYVITPDGPAQLVHPPRPAPFEEHDLENLPEMERLSEGMRHLEAFGHRPFDLKTDLMLRVCLVRLTSDDHLLGLCVHHIASDGWSSGIIFRELSAFYAAALSGQPPVLPPLPIQYADFSIWQRDQLATPEMANHLAFWEQQLGGITPLELPTDRPRPPLQSYRGARYELMLPTALSERLEALARREQTTLFMVLLAAYFALLYRYTGQTDVSVGSPIAGRSRTEVEGLIGFFVNSLVLRGDLSGDPSFRGLLGRVRSTALDAYVHQDVPFDQIVETLQPERDRSRSPLFQTMFALQNVPHHPLELPGVDAERLTLELNMAKFDLIVQLYPEGERLGLRAIYATDLFDEATIVRLANHYQALLEGAVADPEASISRLPMLSEAERVQLRAWNNTFQDYPRNHAIHTLFEEQVARTPDATALIDGFATWSYSELNRRANQLAHALRAQGVGPGVRVGLCVERSARLVLGMLAVLKAGGAYVPLDSDYPAERLAFLLRDANVAVLLTESEVTLPASMVQDLPVIRLDADWPAIAVQQQENLVENDTPGHSGARPAYVMYTSGSTGLPKGVIVPHRAVVHLVRDTDYVHLGPDDVLVQIANSSFDAATFEVWGALLNGARLVIVPREVILSPNRLAETLRAYGVTAMFITTALFNHVVQEKPDAFAPVGTVLVGGQRLEPRWIRTALEAGLPGRLLNGYGPTETTTFAAWYEIESVSEDATNIPIGRPLAGTTLWVLDVHRQPVPVGVPGELYIGGEGVALGYHARPDLTAERFVPDPFTSEPLARLYRTGDRVRRLPNGTIEYLGRLDRQVKLRGYRIEPGEIEAVLGQHPAVREAFVRVEGANSDEHRLVAYVGIGEASIEGVALQTHVRGMLPEYMVPSVFVVMEALPVNANGKLDVQALEGLNEVSSLPQSAQAANPRDPLETQLVSIWQDVMGRPVGVDDDFFEIGGHSLMAARLFIRIEEEFGYRLPLSVLFDAPTISRLADVLRKADVRPSSKTIVLMEAGAGPAFFCAPGVGGNVLRTINVAKKLGTGQAYYGLQSPGFDKRLEPLERIEDMAAYHLEDVRSVQPQGPYFFAGYSFGGLVAYEMARQMRALGEDVALLVLLDSTYPPRALRMVDSIELLKTKAARRLLKLFSKGFYWSRLGKAKRLMMNGLGLHEAPIPSPSEAFWIEHRRVKAASQRALRIYKPEPYEGAAVIVRTTKRTIPKVTIRKRNPLAPWDVLLPAHEVLEIPCTHHDMLEEPYVSSITSHLRDRIKNILHHGDEPPR